MEQANAVSDFGYQMEVEGLSNAVDARGKFPRNLIHTVKASDKPLCNKKVYVDDDDEFIDAEEDYLNEEEIEDEIDDEETEEEEDDESIEESTFTSEFSSGAFLVLKADVRKSVNEPPLWKIDGKALVKKYVPFKRDGKTLYRNTSAYSGWNINFKNSYYPVTVVTLSETQKEHIVEFKKYLVPKEEPELNEECTDDEAGCSKRHMDNECESSDDGEIQSEEMSIENLDGDAKDAKMEENSGEYQNFTCGSFLVEKLDSLEKRPSLIWKIDSKALIQKYVPCESDHGQMLYKSTNAFNGWSIRLKNDYYSAVVVSLEESRKKEVVELKNIIRT